MLPEMPRNAVDGSRRPGHPEPPDPGAEPENESEKNRERARERVRERSRRENGNGAHLLTYATRLILLLAATGGADGVAEPPDRVPDDSAVTIRFRLEDAARVSLTIHDTRGRLVRELLRGSVRERGEHAVEWDGLDGDGRRLPSGVHEWRRLESGGLRARFLTSLGVNPGSGPRAHFTETWVGDHVGAGLLAVDGESITIGSPLTEALALTLRQSIDGLRRHWQRPQYYDGGRLRALAAGDGAVFLLQPDGKLRRLRATDGELEWTRSVLRGGEAPADVDALEDHLVVCYPHGGTVAWLDPASGEPTAEETRVPGARQVAIRRRAGAIEALVEAGGALFSSRPGARVATRLAKLEGELGGGLDVDPSSGDVYLLRRLDGREEVVRADPVLRVQRVYGGLRRSFGPYDPLRLRGVRDLVADGRGGILVAEPTGAPRRVAWFDAASGRLLREWYGGQSFYVQASSDPVRPLDVWGCAQEGHVIRYRFAPTFDRWEVRAAYALASLGDGLFPFTGKWRPVRRSSLDRWRLRSTSIRTARRRATPCRRRPAGSSGRGSSSRRSPTSTRSRSTRAGTRRSSSGWRGAR